MQLQITLGRLIRFGVKMVVLRVLNERVEIHPHPIFKKIHRNFKIVLVLVMFLIFWELGRGWGGCPTDHVIRMSRANKKPGRNVHAVEFLTTTPTP